MDELLKKWDEILEHVKKERTKELIEVCNKLHKEFLEKNDIEFDMLIVGQHFKVEACKNNKIDVMFDDAIDTCESLKYYKYKELFLY